MNDLRQRLAAVFNERKSRNPQYSLRRFAQSLGVSHSVLSQIQRGKRELTAKSIQRFGAALELSPEEIQGFLKNREISEVNRQDLRIAKQKFELVQEDEFESISEWYYLALLELMATADFRPDIEWISKRLEIPAEKAQEAVDRLVRLKMLSIEGDGQWRDLTAKRTTIQLRPHQTSEARKKYQKQILEKAFQAVDRVVPAQRVQVGTTLAIDPGKIDEVRTLVTAFRRKLAQLLQSSPASCSEVYQISVSLFPLTRSAEYQSQDGKTE